MIFAVPDKPEPPRTCTIISTSLPTLTCPSGVITSGTQNVILYCICMTDNVTVGPTYWFFNGTRVTLTKDDGSGNPYSRDNVPSPLIIPLFVTGHDGTYHCESSPLFDAMRTKEDNITLILQGMCNPDSV